MEWKHEVDIKQILERFAAVNLNEVMLELAGHLASYDVFRDTKWPTRFLDGIRDGKTWEEFDEILEDLYDYADFHKIWLGL